MSHPPAVLIIDLHTSVGAMDGSGVAFEYLDSKGYLFPFGNRPLVCDARDVGATDEGTAADRGDILRDDDLAQVESVLEGTAADLRDPRVGRDTSVGRSDDDV